MRRKNRGLLLLQLVTFTLALCVIAGERAETGMRPDESVIHNLMASAQRIYLLQLNSKATVEHFDSTELEEKIAIPSKPEQRTSFYVSVFTISQTQSQTVFDHTASHCYNYEDVCLTADCGPPSA